MMTGALESAYEGDAAERDPAPSSGGSWLPQPSTGPSCWRGFVPRGRVPILLLLVVLAVSVGGLVVLTSSATGATPETIEGCTSLGDPGEYVLGQNFSVNETDCIEIQAQNVTLDGQNQTVEISSGYFVSTAADDFTLRNLTVEGGDKALNFQGTDGVEVRNVTVRGASTGIKVDEGAHTLRDVELRNTQLEGPGSGVVGERLQIGTVGVNGSVVSFDATGPHYLAVDTPAAPPDGNESLDRYLRVSAGSGPLSVHYTSETAAGVEEDSLALWSMADGDTEWTRLDGSTVDSTNRTVTVENYSTFRDIGLFGEVGPNFDVTANVSNDTVVQGDTVTVDATVENDGTANGTQVVNLSADGEEYANQSVDLATNESTPVSFDWNTTDVGPGDTTLTVSSDDTNDSAVVTVLQPANVTVASVDTNSPVVEGEDLLVDATVENVGNQTGTQNVTLAIGGSETVEDTTDVTLDGGENQTVPLAWGTASGDAGNPTATVATDDDNASTAVTVDEPAYFAVRNPAANTPVVENETLVVDATVENTGDRAAEQTVNLTVGNESTVAGTSETLELNASETATVTLNWTASPGDAGDYNATVSTANESATTAVRVDAPADFQVTIDDTNAPVAPTADIRVNATVENLGDQNASQDVNLSVGGSSVDGDVLTLDGSESESVNLSWTTTHDDVGNHTVTVSSENGSNDTTVRVLEPANFSVSVTEPSPVLEGDPLDVNATVENVGELNGTQNLNLTVDGVGEVDDRNVTVNASESKNVTLSWNTSAVDADDSDATFASANDSVDVNVRVDAPANLSIDVVESDDVVVGGEELNVTANVTNVGDRMANQTLTLSTNASVSEVVNKSVSIDGSNSTNVTLSWPTSASDAGNYTATFASANDSEIVDVRVDAPANLSVDVVESDDAVLEGADLNVTANVTNVGNRTADQTLNLSIDDSVDEVANQSVSIDGGNSTNVTLTWATTADDAGDYTATFASANDSADVSVSVDAPANLTVDDTSSDDPVTEGDWLNVTADVTNDGDQNATQTLTFTVNGTERGSRTVTVNASESTEVTLGWNTTTGDAGDYPATFASANDSDTLQLSVEEPSGGGLPPLPGPDPSASFQVSIDGTNAPVTVGETVAVTATVSNVGDATGTEAVTLARAGETLDERTLTLAANASETVALEWTPGEAHLGSNRLVVETGASSDVTDVDVESAPVVDPPPVELTVEETTAPLDAGRPLAVTAAVEATRDVETTVELLDVDGASVDSEAVDLASGESTTVTLTWRTAVEDAGAGRVTVASEGASASADVRLREPAAFTGSIESVNSPVEVDDTLAVVALVESEASGERTGDVVLEIDGTERAVRTVTLAPDDAERVTLEWHTGEADVGEHDLVLRAGADSTGRTVTVENGSSGGFLGGYAPEWAGTAVDYSPTQQDTHVGGFLWLTALIATVGGYLLATRGALDARLLGVTLLVAAARTSTDVLHATVEAITLEPLLALNASLELAAGLLFLSFAAANAEYYRLLDRRGVALLATVGVAGTALAASNPAHGLVFSNVALVEGPFTYVSAEQGPLGWALLAVTLCTLLCSVALLGRSFVAGTDPAWRPVGVLASGLCLAVVVVAASVLQRGPLPAYDYTGAGVAGFLLVATTAVGHELHRIKRDAQRSLIEDLEDPIVITNDAREVVEYNAAAERLLPTIEVDASFSSLVGYEPEWPAPGESTTTERDLAAILPSRTDGGATGPEFDPEELPGVDSGVDPGDQSPDDASGDHVPDDAGEDETSDGAVEDDTRDGAGNPGAAGAGDSGAADTGAVGATTADPIAAPAASTDGELGAVADGQSGDGADGESGAGASEPPSGPGTGSAEALVDRSGDGARDRPPAELHYLVRTTSVTAETGDTLGYTVRFTDVSELRQRTDELSRKNTQLEQVASTISHDLRNPLTVADGYLEIATERVPNPGRHGGALDDGGAEVAPSTIAEQLEPVRESLMRMEAIIDDVLALARSSEPVSVEEDLRFAAVVEDAWRTVDTGRATLFVESDGSIDADPRRFQRILENLFRNAVDHVGEDVAVLVGLTDDGFYVADDGPGIPEDQQSDVFEQGHTSSQDGTGLGLSIVTQLARAHGWSVAVDSEYDGARFVFEGCDVSRREPGADE